MDRNSERSANKSSELSIALKKISYGFYILTTKKAAENLTTREKDYYAAGTVSWVSQVSFDPPLVMVAVQKDSDLNETIAKSRHFALNIVGKAQLPMLNPFAKETTLEGNKLNGFEFGEGQTGSPILSEVPAFFECELEHAFTPSGDHMIFVGKVVHAGVRNEDAEPLIEWETNFHYGG